MDLAARAITAAPPRASSAQQPCAAQANGAPPPPLNTLTAEQRVPPRWSRPRAQAASPALLLR